MAHPVIKRGSKGAHVKTAQSRLKAHGFSIGADGQFGPGTEAVVKRFQSLSGLKVDGIIGPATWTKLNATPAFPTIRRGASGRAVVSAQNRLNSHTFKVGIDGKFGPGTESVVKNFQSKYGLAVDGIVGPATWKALFGGAKKTTTTAPAPVVNRKPDVKRILSLLGWRVDTEARYVQAVKDFQGVWNLGPALTVDGNAGPKTHAALKISEARRKAGRGDISEHFSTHELDCKCLGKYASCRRIWATRRLIQALEKYRTLSGPFTPISVCRCPRHNATVGGSTNSPHMSGLAADVPAVYSVSRVRALRVFTNIGYNSKGGTVRHVDVRSNTTGTVTSPRTYPY